MSRDGVERGSRETEERERVGERGEKMGAKSMNSAKAGVRREEGESEDGKRGLECGKTNECFRLDALQK